MERNNAEKGIYLCYNNKYNNNKVKQVWDSSTCEDVDVVDIIDDEFFYVDHERMMMMAWPPRSYTCSFCKREFRSAQALGGHMNVHRRDRAQLRQLSHVSPTSSPIATTNSTPLNLNFPPSPSNNVTIPPSTPSPKPAFVVKKIQPTCTRSSPTVARPPPPPPSLLVKQPSHDFVTRNQFEYFRRINNLVLTPNNCPQAYKGVGSKQQEDIQGNLKRAPGLFRLDLEMNINVGDHHGVIKENLDLELRLGYN